MSKLLIVFPVLSMAVQTVTFASHGGGRRQALLSAAIVWGVLLTAITETLSLFHRLNFEWLSGAWLLAIVLQTGICLWAGKGEASRERCEFAGTTRALLLCTLMVVAVTGAVAVIAPPNNWDSMTYHMSRVMHWIQNQSVAHYPTSILRQIELSPWAEFAVTHFQVLSGGDRFANLVQWFSMAGAILGVSLIAKEFGADLRGQVIAAAVAATIPMGILQSSSTQNDCVVAFWLVCLAYFCIKFKQGFSWPYALAIGASLGLAILTKGTAYLYAFPFMAWLVVVLLKSEKPIAFGYLGLVMAAALALNSGHYTRNFQAFGNVLSSSQLRYSNAAYSVSALSSNVIRNVGLEMGSPFDHLNKYLKPTVTSIHAALGLNVNDPDTTFPNTRFDVVPSLHEDSAGNPLHTLLIVLSICVIPLRFRQHKNLLPYTAALIVGFLFFCLYLRWQPWHNRLLLPLMILWSPVIALVIAGSKEKRAMNLVLGMLVLMSLPFLFLNQSRPLVSYLDNQSILCTDRKTQYFSNKPGAKQAYVQITERLVAGNCSDIGLRIGGDTWEYPLWVLLQEKFGPRLHMEHVDVGNASAKIPPMKTTFDKTVSIDR